MAQTLVANGSGGVTLLGGITAALVGGIIAPPPGAMGCSNAALAAGKLELAKKLAQRFNTQHGGEWGWGGREAGSKEGRRG